MAEGYTVVETVIHEDILWSAGGLVFCFLNGKVNLKKH